MDKVVDTSAWTDEQKLKFINIMLAHGERLQRISNTINSEMDNLSVEEKGMLLSEIIGAYVKMITRIERGNQH